MQQSRQTMLEMQNVLRSMEQELPDTAAAMRLSSLELSDAIEEVSMLRCASAALSCFYNMAEGHQGCYAAIN